MRKYFIILMLIVSHQEISAQKLLMYERLGSFIDERDSANYKSIVLGNQTWMAENLRYQEGNSLFNSMKYDTCDNCGRYYTYDEALVACPPGWHLPNDDEWIELEMFVGMLGPHTKHTDPRGSISGQATFLLKYGNSGFDLYLCGFIYQVGKIYIPHLFAERGYYWTSTEASKQKAFYRMFNFNVEAIKRGRWDKTDRFPVRCVKDK